MLKYINKIIVRLKKIEYKKNSFAIYFFNLFIILWFLKYTIKLYFLI